MIELGLQMGGVPRFGQNRNYALDWRRCRAGLNPRSADLHFQNLDPLTEVERLRDSSNARAAVHALNAKRKF